VTPGPPTFSAGTAAAAMDGRPGGEGGPSKKLNGPGGTEAARATNRILPLTTMGRERFESRQQFTYRAPGRRSSAPFAATEQLCNWRDTVAVRWHVSCVAVRVCTR